jgi:myo-inositol-1(or 4)-monophosphatase
MNYEFICKHVVNATQEAGHFIQSEAKQFQSERIEKKGLNDFVSYVDKASEELLTEALSELLPEAGFIAEEGTRTYNGEQLKWVIDPLDGTTNFIHGIPTYAISVALMDGDEVVIGVVYELNLNECFYAWKGGPAYKDGIEIKVSDAKSVQDSLVATGFPYKDFDKMNAYMATLEYFLKHSHGARRIGSAATDLAYVACGRFEAFYEYGLKPWDVAAGALILQCAGGKLCDFSGKDNYIFGKELIATNGHIHNEFLDVIKKHF